MTKRVADQADGLRRLLAHTTTRVIAIAGMSPGDGATTAAMNLAAALVQQGKDVLLIDEQDPDPSSAAAVWATHPPGTLADVAARRASCDAAAGHADCGVVLLPAPQHVQHVPIDLRALRRGGVVLIDAALDEVGRLSTLARLADELVLVLQPHAASITAAYAGIKRLHYAHGLKQLRFMINRASGIEEARKITSNLASTGSRYLAVSLEPAGCIRADAHLADARRLSQTVVEAFPASPAAVDFRRIAGEMLRWPWREPARAARAEGSSLQERRGAMPPARVLHAPSAALA